jgi:hypothetical protein
LFFRIFYYKKRGLDSFQKNAGFCLSFPEKIYATLSTFPEFL